jgi:hypothetical protein
LSEAFRGGGFGGVPNPDEVKGGGSDQRDGGGSANTIHNTTNNDPNRVAEGNQEGETVEGGATIRGKVRDENKPRDTVNETCKRSSERKAPVAQDELEGFPHDRAGAKNVTDAVIISVAEVAGSRRARAFEGVNGAVGVEMAASLVGGQGIAKETNAEDTKKAGQGGGEGLEVVVQEAWGGAEMAGAGEKMVVEVRAILTRGGLGG